MIKVFCDTCGCEGASNRFSYHIHLDKPFNGAGYRDAHGNDVSGRALEVDLCNKCYNDIVGAAVAVLKAKQANKMHQ